MYFFKKKGQQQLDLTGNLILSHNDRIIKARGRSAAPAGVKHGRYVLEVHALGFFSKVRLLCSVAGFIWGPNTALTAEAINRKDPN